MAKAKIKPTVNSSALEKTIVGAVANISNACAIGDAAIAVRMKDAKKLLAEGKSFAKKKAVLSKRLKAAKVKATKNPGADTKKALKVVEKDLATISKDADKSTATKATNTEQLAELKLYVKRMKAYLKSVTAIDKDMPKPVKKEKKVAKKAVAKKKPAAQKTAAKTTEKKKPAKKAAAKSATAKSATKVVTKLKAKTPTKPKAASKPIASKAKVSKAEKSAIKKAAPAPTPTPEQSKPSSEGFGTQEELAELKDLMGASDVDDAPELTSAVPMSDDITDDDFGSKNDSRDSGDGESRPW